MKLARLVEQARDLFFGSVPAGPTSLGSIVGGPSSAGVMVSEETAEGLPVVFSCVRVIANAVAQLPLKLFALDAVADTKTEAVDHPLASVLHEMSNPEMTAFEFRAAMTAQLLLWGNSYAKIDRNPLGQVTALWPLYPWLMAVDRDERRRLRFHYGNDTWLYDPALPPVLRLNIHSLDGVTGRSPLRVLREALGGAIALQRFGNEFFGNGATFGGILTSPDDLDTEQQTELRANIERLHRGPDRAHKFLILSDGLTYTRMGIPPEDAQFLESKKFSRSELAGIFGVPSHMIGDLEKATFSNVENESLRWLRDGLEPHLVNWESSLRRDCLGPRAFDWYYARFTRQAAVRGDLKSRADALHIMRNDGIISANEWRTWEDLNPRTDAGGAEFILSSQSKSSSEPTPPEPTPPTPPTRQALERDLEAARTEANLARVSELAVTERLGKARSALAQVTKQLENEVQQRRRPHVH